MSKTKKGLTAAEVAEAKSKYGLNVLTPPPAVPAWKLYLEKFDDPIIKILCVASVISIVVGFIEGNLIEPIGILVAIALATGVGFWMEWSAKKKFDLLQVQADSEPVKVVRDGETCLVPKDQLVPGDLVILATGDEVPADIELFEALDLKIEESTMTGESVPAGKRAKQGNEAWEGSGFAPWSALRSTRVMEGSGKGIIVATGDNTEIGKITRATLEESGIETPLQQQLDRLGALINKAAFVVAGVLLVLLNVTHWCFTDGVDTSLMGIFMAELKFLMAAVTLICVACPEGLPLASTLSLAFAMKTMAKENNLVKKMHASETIGAIDIICSDKTSTLTQGVMSVVETHVHKGHTLAELLAGAAINSSASLDKNHQTIGNPSEGAMLRFCESKDTDWKELRESAVITRQRPFNSTDKYMLTQVGDTVYVKGAPEVISKLTGNKGYLVIVEAQQQRGRRAISCAQGPSEDSLEYVGTFFIEDPIRSEVPGAIQGCYGAGIDVIMMTGDNCLTAAEIAKQAGFDGKDDGVWAIEAKDFDKVAWKDGYSYPNVIARCKPDDKLHILTELQKKGHICAMTGDGVNDSPSLNHANVGIAMGSGTSVAKEAADIVLLDDAFPSIVTGIKWGRSLYKNIQSFLTMQLVMNVATCLVVLFGPVLGQEMPFTICQMLWVNLVLDTISALCLASEPADSNVLLDKPRRPEDFVITRDMWKVIWGLGLFEFILLSVLVWNSSHTGFLPFQTDLTVVFAVFLVLNWWNLFNIRVFGKGRSVFHGLTGSKNFLLGSMVVLLGTVGIVQLGGEVFSTHPLSLFQWFLILLVTSPMVIVRELWYQAHRK